MFECIVGDVWMGRVGGQVLVGVGVSGLPGELVCFVVQLTGDIDIFMSHDWPREIYHHGNLEQLLRFKPYFRSEAMSNTLGSPAAKELLDHLQPHKWWAGHLHCRFEASYVHGLTKDGTVMPAKRKSPVEGFPMGKGIWGNSTISTAPMRHPPMGWPQMGQPPMGGPGMGNPPMDQTSSIGHPPKVTEFLALDKCLPKRKCLEVCAYVVHKLSCPTAVQSTLPLPPICLSSPSLPPRCLTSPIALTQRS